MTISATTQGLRQGVCTSSNRPATPFEGQMIYETDTDLTYVYGGSAWQQVAGGTAVGNSGLVYVAETTFSAASNPFINGCFSSTYANYRVLVSLSTSAQTNVRFRWRYGTSTTETALKYDRFGTSFSGATVTTLVSIAEASWYIISTTNGLTEIAPVTMDIYSPNLAVKTLAQSNAWNSASGATHLVNCRMDNTTQYTGLEIFADSGTLTGSIRVYGYRQV